MMGKSIDIVGGGLAGLSLGVALQSRGVTVRVHEAMAYPKHRVCGEFISGVSEETLHHLGIAPLFEHCLRHHHATWWSGAGVLSSFTLPYAAYGISRYRLDQQLCERLRSMGGEVIEGARCSIEQRESEGIVWAAGRRPTSHGKWVGLTMHVREIALETSLEMHLGDWGYVGLSAVEDGWVNVCGLFRIRPEARGRQNELLIDYIRRCGLLDLAERLASAKHREGSHAAVAGFQLGRQALSERGFSIGDAESIIPPFTGNGMSMALQSAEMAVPFLLDYAQGHLRWAECCAQMSDAQRKLFRRRLGVAQGFHSALLDPLWRRPIEILAQRRLLPFRLLFSLTR